MDGLQSAALLHRQNPPGLVVTVRNEYVRAIRDMRSHSKGLMDQSNQRIGPIAFAVDNIEGFKCSASGWSRQHLTRFQVIPVGDVVIDYLFPMEYLLEDTDETMIALENEGFFEVELADVQNGRWDTQKLFHFVFLNMMMLLRGTAAPSPKTSPPQQIWSHPRDAKELARSRIRETFLKNESPRTPSISRVSSGASTDSSISSMQSIYSNSSVDSGPRETLSFIFVHCLLAYLGTVQYNATKGDSPLWISSYSPLLLKI
jgi:hypothetical protein